MYIMKFNCIVLRSRKLSSIDIKDYILPFVDGTPETTIYFSLIQPYKHQNSI